MSLLKFSGLSLKDIDAEIEKEATHGDSCEEDVADSIADILTDDHWPSANDTNIIYYAFFAPHFCYRALLGNRHSSASFSSKATSCGKVSKRSVCRRRKK